jgi:hypothetical protein
MRPPVNWPSFSVITSRTISCVTGRPSLKRRRIGLGSRLGSGLERAANRERKACVWASDPVLRSRASGRDQSTIFRSIQLSVHSKRPYYSSKCCERSTEIGHQCGDSRYGQRLDLIYLCGQLTVFKECASDATYSQTFCDCSNLADISRRLSGARKMPNPGVGAAGEAQSSILVDPFSPLHHQCVAWILSG